MSAHPFHPNRFIATSEDGLRAQAEEIS